MRWRWLTLALLIGSNLVLLWYPMEPLVRSYLAASVPSPRLEVGLVLFLLLGLSLPPLWMGYKIPWLRVKLGSYLGLLLIFNALALLGLVASSVALRQQAPPATVAPASKKAPAAPSPVSTPGTDNLATEGETDRTSAVSVLTSKPPDRYAEIDAHALAAPTAVEQRLDTLAEYLIKPARDDREKMRAIYRWVSDRIAYDSAAAADAPKATPEGTLETRLAVGQGYAQLTDALAKAAGLESEVVAGYAYTDSLPAPGESRDNHAWNAVKFEGDWRLIDTAWAAGGLDKERAFRKLFNPAYFAIEPKVLLSTHFPAQDRWQLTDQNLKWEDFLAQPKLYPGFFVLGLKLRSQATGPWKAAPTANIQLEAPVSVCLLAELRDSRKANQQRSTLISREGGRAVVSIMAPSAGQYTLRLFAGSYAKAETGLPLVAEFPIKADTGSTDGYPVVSPELLQRQGRVVLPAIGRFGAGRQRFDLYLPGASKVFVNAWDNVLKKEGDHFTGEVLLELGEANLFAVFVEGDDAKGVVSYEVARKAIGAREEK